jgi:hypothetical protein
MNETELNINKIAQNTIPSTTGLEWFEEHLENGNGSEILNTITTCIQQAHPKPEEIEKAITLSNIKPTFTPCVLLKTKELKLALSQIINLPRSEQIKSFKLLISLLSVADERRRNTECKDGCQHDWHNIK